MTGAIQSMLFILMEGLIIWCPVEHRHCIHVRFPKDENIFMSRVIERGPFL